MVKPRFFIVLSVIAAMVFFAGTMAVRMRMDRNAQVLRQIRQEEQALVDKIERLEDETRYAQTEEYLENAVRKYLNWIMPGEIQYLQGTD